MRALSIRQPYAELILRGIKPIEFRSRPTKRIGERFYIYASQQWAEGKLFLEGCRSKSGVAIVGDNIEVPTEGPQPWMLELAKMLILKDLPTGVIVGTASIREVVKARQQSRGRCTNGILPTWNAPSDSASPRAIRSRFGLRRFKPLGPER